MVRNLIEQIIFFLTKIPTWQETMQRIPEGTLIRYKMSDISISNLEWKEGWTKTYDTLHPTFRDNRPFAQTLSSRENITQENELMQLTQPKKAGTKDAYIQSNFTVKYGTTRSLIKLPSVCGGWSAFWLFDGLPEMDIFEHCGGWKHKVSVTHHWGYDYNNVPNPKGKKMTRHNARYNRKFNPTEEFYLYEVELTPYKIIYKINGIKVRTLKRHLSSGENRVIFDVTKGDYCNSNLNTTLDRDATMEVDFLEVYKM